jgi:hypothetical protein
MSGFSQTEASALLARCHRRCCICHRYCGVKIELDHIIPRREGGTDEIENAIPVCFECHAEIHSYNDQHPRGRKFRPEELRLHRDQWLKLVEQNTDVLVPTRNREDVGPLQALIDELDFNLSVSMKREGGQPGCSFLVTQFQRALAAGSISILSPELKETLLEAYCRKKVPGTCRGAWGDRALAMALSGVNPGNLNGIQSLNAFRSFSGYTSGTVSCGAHPNRPPADAEAVKEPACRDQLGTKGSAGGKQPAGKGTSRRPCRRASAAARKALTNSA